ncbi:hypothetical protein [Sphingomonas sp. 1185]|uniref:hypothetical protein n=1 Tax=Sphingomonas sp. 1185 TaxID=3156411 RepID=UPI003396837D
MSIPNSHFDPADADCWIAHGRKAEHAALIAAAWRDYPDLPPSAPLADRQARSRARVDAMRPVNEQIRLESEREQELANYRFIERQVRLGKASPQDAAILTGRDRYGYRWLMSVAYAAGWSAAKHGWDFHPPGPNLRGVVPSGTTEAYDQGFTDGGGRRDDIFDTARRRLTATPGTPAATPHCRARARPLPSDWPKPSDAHRAVAWNRRLVILAAGRTHDLNRSAPAIEFLDHPLAEEIRRTPGTSQAHIIILSAAHGFIDGHARLAPWSEAMRPETAEALSRSQRVRQQLATLLKDIEIDDILVAAESDYLWIIDAHAAILPLCRIMERTRNTPLQQRAHCRTWLARGCNAGENVGAGHIRWSKVIQGLTGRLGEFTARYGGKVEPRGHRILIEIAPGVPAVGYVTAAGIALAPEIVISNKARMRIEMARALRAFGAATRLAIAA